MVCCICDAGRGGCPDQAQAAWAALASLCSYRRSKSGGRHCYDFLPSSAATGAIVAERMLGDMRPEGCFTACILALKYTLAEDVSAVRRRLNVAIHWLQT